MAMPSLALRTRRELLSQLSLASLWWLSRETIHPLQTLWFHEGKLGCSAALQATLRTAPPLIQPSNLTPFVDPLPIPPVAKPTQRKAAGDRKPDAAPLYRLPMRAFQTKVHRDVPPTTVWGYADSFPGPTIEVRRQQPIWIEWVNQLPQHHFLPIDPKLSGAEPDLPEVRTVVHLHGGRVPAESDGYPENWFPTGKSATYFYPNQQEAAGLWYHDHTMGIERLNVYAGLFGAYIVRDEEEDGLNLPRGKYEIPLLLSDRMLRQDGQFYYPISLNPEGPWVPQVFGDCFLVNGKLLPYLDVEPAKYRLRILNASNARFFLLSLENGQDFHQIGTDQGLLGRPVEVQRLQLASGERADVIVDFAESRGAHVVLRNDLLPLLEFRVSRQPITDPSSLPKELKKFEALREEEAELTRMLTLEEHDNLIGKPTRMLLNGSRWHDPVTEKPRQGSIEIWRLVNLTADTHPIHLHQVRFQVLDRRPIFVPAYRSSKTMTFRGPATVPVANEAGWKDTVRVASRGVTRIIVRFDGNPGRFVWHCHTLEHAANEMMRPYEICCA
jgi:spore coat protein A, manganese oxidase